MARTVTPPAVKKKKKPKPPVLREQDLVANLPPPNHRLPLEEEPTAAQAYRRWPLVQLEHADPDRGTVGVFVAKLHKVPDTYAWADHPPTWMDPHLFVAFCDRDAEIQALCEAAFKHNNPKPSKALLAAMQRVFDEQYLPYLIRRFERDASPPLAAWIVRRDAYRRTDPRRQVKRASARPRQPPAGLAGSAETQ